MNRTHSFELSKDEKRKVKQRMANLAAAGGGVFSFPESRLTVAVCPAAVKDPHFVYVSVSHCADHEPKFRKTLGALYAMDRLEYGTPMPVRLGPNETIRDVAENIRALND